VEKVGILLYIFLENDWLCQPYFYSVLFSLAMWNWNKGGCVCDIVKGRKTKQRGITKYDSLQLWEKSEFVTLQGIPSFNDVFRPLLAVIMHFTTFSYQLRIGETQRFRLLLLIVHAAILSRLTHPSWSIRWIPLVFLPCRANISLKLLPTEIWFHLCLL
jgi:hypothetical protein